MEDEADPSFLRRLWTFLGTTRGRVLAALGFLASVIVTALVNYLLPGGLEAMVQRRPVAVVVEANADNIDVGGSPVGGSYVIARPIQEIGPAPIDSDDCVGRFNWAHDLGGVDAEVTAVRVVVEGKWSSPVTINGVRPRVVRAAAPLIGSHLTCPGKGEVADIRQLTVDLQRSKAPTYEYHAAKDDANKSFAFNLEKGKTELFYVTAQAVDCDCEWVVDLNLIADGRKTTVTVDNHGKPFRTTAASNARSYFWSRGRWTDQSLVPGGTGPAGGVIKPPRQTACKLIARTDAEQIFGQRMTNPSGGGFQESRGAAVELTTTSQCSYTFGKPDSAGFVPTLNIMYTAARNPAEGNREYDNIKAMMAPPSKWTALVGLGDEAYASSGAILMRNRQELVIMTLAPPNAVDRADERIRQLAGRAAKRAWP